MTKGRVFRVVYPPPGRRDRQRFRFPMRDAEAGMRLTLTLAKQGYDYCDDLYQPPSMGPDLVDSKEVNECFFCETDLIVWLGRPPMDDADFGGRKKFPRSYTWLEDTLMKHTLRPWFKTCARRRSCSRMRPRASRARSPPISR
jgi:hypothetical protein